VSTKSSGLSDKEYLLELIRILKRDDVNYYLPRAMDFFYGLSSVHQKNLLKHVTDANPQDEWLDGLEDDTLYPDVIRSMLYYYSGRTDLGQPCKADLGQLVGEYVKSASTRELLRDPAKASAFTEALKSM
jgi:hypothetical protein